MDIGVRTSLFIMIVRELKKALENQSELPNCHALVKTIFCLQIHKPITQRTIIGLSEYNLQAGNCLW